MAEDNEDMPVVENKYGLDELEFFIENGYMPNSEEFREFLQEKYQDKFEDYMNSDYIKNNPNIKEFIESGQEASNEPGFFGKLWNTVSFWNDKPGFFASKENTQAGVTEDGLAPLDDNDRWWEANFGNTPEQQASNEPGFFGKLWNTVSFWNDKPGFFASKENTQEASNEPGFFGKLLNTVSFWNDKPGFFASKENTQEASNEPGFFGKLWNTVSFWNDKPGFFASKENTQEAANEPGFFGKLWNTVSFWNDKPGFFASKENTQEASNEPGFFGKLWNTVSFWNDKPGFFASKENTQEAVKEPGFFGKLWNSVCFWNDKPGLFTSKEKTQEWVNTQNQARAAMAAASMPTQTAEMEAPQQAPVRQQTRTKRRATPTSSKSNAAKEKKDNTDESTQIQVSNSSKQAPLPNVPGLYMPSFDTGTPSKDDLTQTWVNPEKPKVPPYLDIFQVPNALSNSLPENTNITDMYANTPSGAPNNGPLPTQRNERE